MEVYQIALYAMITIFSLGLFAVSLASYRTHKNTKLLFVTGVFAIFLVKGILLSISLFYQTLAEIILAISLSGLFDVLILALLFLATLKR